MIWKRKVTLELLNSSTKNTLVDHLEIRFTKIGADFIEATMPVNERTIQPYGLLHGGASAALAETLGSVAAAFSADPNDVAGVVGIEISASHLKSVRSGIVTGRVTPIKIGRQIQVWDIEIKDEHDNLCCHSKLTTTSLKK